MFYKVYWAVLIIKNYTVRRKSIGCFYYLRYSLFLILNTIRRQPHGPSYNYDIATMLGWDIFTWKHIAIYFPSKNQCHYCLTLGCPTSEYYKKNCNPSHAYKITKITRRAIFTWKHIFNYISKWKPILLLLDFRLFENWLLKGISMITLIIMILQQ